MDLDDFDRLAASVRNWGRWGADDRLGTLNLVTPEVRVRAAASVRQGKVFSLGLDLASDGPQPGPGPGPAKLPSPVGRFNPHLYLMALSKPLGVSPRRWAYTDDAVHLPLQCATQWDGLAHVEYDGVLYNGLVAADTLTVSGASDLGIEHVARVGIASRGVLLDIARLRGVGRIEGAVGITPDDLEAAEAAQGVTVESGDIVLVRTGHISTFTVDRDRAAYNGPQPGLEASCAPWLHERGVAALAVDNVAVEPLGRPPGEFVLPLHMLGLRDMGMTFGEMFDLDALAADCAADGQSTFLLTAPPLRTRGAVGSTVNPLALK